MNNKYKYLLEQIDDKIQLETLLEQRFQKDDYIRGYFGGRVDALKMVKFWIEPKGAENKGKEKEKCKKESTLVELT